MEKANKPKDDEIKEYKIMLRKYTRVMRRNMQLELMRKNRSEQELLEKKE